MLPAEAWIKSRILLDTNPPKTFRQHRRSRGSPGPRVRLLSLLRYNDGTFMHESVKDAAYFAEYERFARGGRARAARSVRADDGTFL